MKALDLQTQIGQRLAVGFPGYEIPSDLAELVRRYHVGNIILFAENIRDNGQLKRLCRELQELIAGETGFPAFIGIDQEGGVVSRLGPDAATPPSAMCVAATGDPRNAYEAGLITGRELRALGVNFDFAPDMDVNSNPQNPVIGVRSYGDTPEIVARYGTEMMRGLTDGGVLCCAKHFPGHGDTALDSHLSLPIVDKSLAELEACELKPFRAAIAAGVPAIMTTHILFPQLEPEKTPATMSRRIITGLLKETLGFTGLVVSDCMMMQAIQAYYGTVNGILAAVGAGVDLVLSSHSIEYARKACEAMREAVLDGGLSAEEMKASAEKIISAKAALAPAPDNADIVGCEAHRQTVRRIMDQGLTLVGSPTGECPPLGQKPLFMGCHPFRPTIASNPEDESVSFPETMRSLLGGEAVNTPTDPTDEEIGSLALRAAGHSAVVIGTYNGHIKTGQLKLVRALARLDAPVICVALRNPYDLLGLPDGVTRIAAYEYDSLSMEAVARLLRGEQRASGRLPLSIVEA